MGAPAWLRGILLLSLLAGCRDASVSGELRQLADAPIKVVWCRQQSGTDDVFAKKAGFLLMGFDPQDRPAERVILNGPGSYHKPLFSSTGDRIVFTDVPKGTIYAVNWDGTGLTELSSGLAEEVWADPETGIEWVYKMSVTTDMKNPAHEAWRFQLDNPAVEEVVVTDMPLNADHIQLSQDGAYMCVQHPWPQIGALHVESGEVKEVGKGCWPAMAPDNSYLMWIFDGPHRNLIFHSLDGKRWVVNINGASGINGVEVYHPRWGNLDRFLCMTGPYRRGVYKGGADVSVYVGRFNEKLTKVDEWVQVSDRKAADFYPDVWVKPGVGRYADVDYVHFGEASAVDHEEERLVVKARLVEKTPMPTLADIAPYTQTLVVYRYKVNDVVSGQFDGRQLLVAHWGIVDRKTIDLPLKVGDLVELELEPYENRGELEGERLVMELTDMRHPLFYDLKGK